MKKVNKDFYTFLPKYLQRDLDKKIELYSEEEWFEDAWNKYREHCWEADKKHMESPNLFFMKYLDIDHKCIDNIKINPEEKNSNPWLNFSDHPYIDSIKPIVENEKIENNELEIEKESKEEHEEPV